MATKIKIIRSTDYLMVSDDGIIDFEESKARLYNLAEAKRPPADYEILLDFRRTQWLLSTEDIFELAQVVVNYPDSFRDKIALLALPGVSFDKAVFQELCSNSQGITVGTYTNYEDAIQWFHSVE
ncbi:MAG: hypothetical protein P1P86_14580 [Bacteroidales bacterium]|nr:hypothetical protein [Bacteroidales bacterium]